MGCLEALVEEIYLDKPGQSSAISAYLRDQALSPKDARELIHTRRRPPNEKRHDRDLPGSLSARPATASRSRRTARKPPLPATFVAVRGSVRPKLGHFAFPAEWRAFLTKLTDR